MTDSADSGQPPTVSLHELFDQLRHRRRRRILVELKRGNPRNSEAFTASDAVDGIALYHNHLPKLADAGFIDWDRESDAIRRGSRFAEIAPLLSFMTDHKDRLPEGWP